VSTMSPPDKETVYSILLVDDDSSVREIIGMRLTSLGFSITTAVNGMHAMQRLKGATTPFHLVITDLSMPGQGGLDLISSIKTSPEFKHLPVITLTGNIDVEVLKSAKLKGADEVLVKPVSFNALLERIQAHI
jgi:two-component system chemotaxis response regulator CheY